MGNEGRREFLRALSLGPGVTASASLPGCGGGQVEAARPLDDSATRPSLLLDDRAFWEEIRQSFVRQAAATSFNVDERLMRLKAPMTAMRRRSDSAELMVERMRFASSLGAQTEELAFTSGASVGISRALTGVTWRQGDAVIHTDHEHPNTLAVLRSIQQFYGVALIEARLPRGQDANADAIVDVVEIAILDARRRGWTPTLLVWSSPTYQTGVMVPVTRMTRLARRYGLMTVCDGAHLLGMVDFRFSELDLDVLALSGHKWQCGPPLTGLLLTRASAHQQDAMRSAWHPLLPVIGGNAQAHQAEALDVEMQRMARTIGRRFGELAATSEWWDVIGRTRIESRMFALNRYLKTRIVDAWGPAGVLSPMSDPELESAITAFDPFPDRVPRAPQRTYLRFVERMRADHAFVVRSVELPRRRDEEDRSWAIRICTPIWIDTKDVDDLVDAMRGLSSAMLAEEASGA